MRKRIFFIFFILFFGVGVFSIPFFIFAQGTGLSVSPLTFELTANPGDEISNIVKVFNTGDSLTPVTMEAEDFSPVGEAGQVAISPEESETYSIAKWVRIEPETFMLEPQEFKAVEFRVSVPLNAEPGGHYGSILASISGGTIAGGGTAIAQKVGALLLLQVAGEVREQLSINTFEAPQFSEYGPITLASRFENTGTVHLKPRGFILIKDILGREVAQLNLVQKNVLPDSIRKIETVLDKKYLFGRYEAILTAIYGSANEPLSAVTTFWVIPWKITLGILLALAIIIFYFFKTRKRWKTAIKILFKGEKTLS
jgi:hypothetical protein